MSGLAQLAKMGVKGADALVDALRSAKKFVAPQDEALALAQQRAALPVEKGGLGLSPTNTAAERAKAMGYQPSYHGTNADIKKFDLGRSGQSSGIEQHGVGVYTATNPQIASGYANTAKEGANVMPLMVRMEKPLNDAATSQLTKQQVTQLIKQSPELDDVLWNFGDVGYEGAAKVLNNAANTSHQYQNQNTLKTLGQIGNDFYPNSPVELNNALAKTLKKDGVQVDLPNVNDGKFLIPWNADQVRSQFAAFDPFRKTAATAAAMGVAAPDLLAQELRKK
jgi:hypothetical protein